jgi:hypothetical protein
MKPKQDEIERILRVKKKLKNNLIKLPFIKKIEIVIQMQKMQAKIKRKDGKKIYVWKL